MRLQVWINKEDMDLIEKLNLSPSELLREVIEMERVKHNEFMRRGCKNAIQNKASKDN